MTEAELQAAVLKLCTDLYLYAYHPYDSRRSEKGFPDLVIIGSRVLFRELKSQSGQLSSEQRRTGYRLTAAGADWEVWRPADLMDGTIARTLTGLTRRRENL